MHVYGSSNLHGITKYTKIDDALFYVGEYQYCNLDYMICREEDQQASSSITSSSKLFQHLRR